MIYRIYVEKKAGVYAAPSALCKELQNVLGLPVENLRLINRYDVENVEKDIYERAINGIFSEPQVDDVFFDLTGVSADFVFGVEYLPGQYDQRADSAEQCIQLMAKCPRPTVKTAKLYAICGKLSEEQRTAIKSYLINPVESREADLSLPKTLQAEYDRPSDIETLTGFTDADDATLYTYVSDLALAMDFNDLKFCQSYFKNDEGRDPTMTEIRMLDTYWSDHCRHTTFLTTIDEVKFDNPLVEAAYNDYLASRAFIGRTKPINLMDLATIAAKDLKKKGFLPKIDESEEINACTVKIKVDVDGVCEDWLLLFKNETHNHPTEIEPFGGAATCIGGAIRDPLSGRAYVYAAMRVTGAGNPLAHFKDTMRGKLPQRKIVRTAADGYSSYGNQIGLTTGQVDEIYHEGYTAKRMEIGAVVGAVRAENVRREEPIAGDLVILLGGRTGRDGCGGATGSSKSHTEKSLSACGAEVQKGNAPTERKLQRLFREKEVSLLIKRCNDFGAGGVSVAIGELADGLKINLDLVPKKYEGLSGTEIAISESQERMAVVVDKADAEKFIALASAENLEATIVAVVTEEPRLVMSWRDKVIVNVSREFLNSNGAERHTTALVSPSENFDKQIPESFSEGFQALVSDLNVCNKRGLSERFDSTIGAGTILMPFGGKYQRTPSQVMAHKIALEHGDTKSCSVMAYGFNPFITEKSPYHGAYLAVVESLAKLAACGADIDDTYLTFQEYFERMGAPETWGKPLSALLGAYKAQTDLNIASIGGKDSMSGSFEHIHVPPTLVSFAVTKDNADNIISNEFKKPNDKVVLITPNYDKNGLPEPDSLLAVFKTVVALIRDKRVISAQTVTFGGVAEAIYKMCTGNGLGFKFEDVSNEELFGYRYGAFILETETDLPIGRVLGFTTDGGAIEKGAEAVSLSTLDKLYDEKLERVYKTKTEADSRKIETLSFSAKSKTVSILKSAKPTVAIPVFPGTNCEYDAARAFERAGAIPEIFVVNNLSEKGVMRSVEDFAKQLSTSQILFIPGGFSGGDEPEGSGKFITSFIRNGAISREVTRLLDERGGLVGGICNGFQALVKLGLLPFGKICDMDETTPTLTFNKIARHQSRLASVRVASDLSPWLSLSKVGEIYNVAISHGEGNFVANDEALAKLIANGQIATQYVDLSGEASYDVDFNPNDSVYAIEGITSPDGRVFGKMGHTERAGTNLYKNVAGSCDMKLFDAAVKFFK